MEKTKTPARRAPGRAASLSAPDILRQLKAMADPANVAGMARFGMSARKRLGISMPHLRSMAREAGRDHARALQLWKSGIPEARIMAALTAVPGELTGDQMDAWAGDFDSWDVCDQVCMNLFDRSPLAWQKVGEWSGRDGEYVRRAAFALIACLAWHDREAGDGRFLGFLPLIRDGALDERNYVKKAVSWALRHIGKRNPRLWKAAMKTARELKHLDSKAARWIASDVIRDLEGRRAVKART
ncbi:MAG: DNA alkylation repair protein [Bacteroidota bacterium]